MTSLPEALEQLAQGKDLGEAAMEQVMRSIMGGEATPAQIGGFLMALRCKGSTVEEIAAAARVMRELATPVNVVPTNLIDTCGTGGDACGTFNVSTACAFVAAAGGARVAKHGNRSVSSKSGSADVLEAAGVNIDLTPEQVASCIDAVGVGFLFAPAHHAATKHAVGPRKELGVRTLFNLLGPLTNPAGARRQLMGVFHPRWVEPVAEVHQRLGSEHVMVVHSEDGLDEISIGAPTQVAELKNGRVGTWGIVPEAFGVTRTDLDALKVDSAADSLAMIRSALNGEAGPAFDIVMLNSGAALYVSGVVDDLLQGVESARKILRSGMAASRLDQLARLTHAI